jgi:hypothetical protein
MELCRLYAICHPVPGWHTAMPPDIMICYGHHGIEAAWRGVPPSAMPCGRKCGRHSGMPPCYWMTWHVAMRQQGKAYGDCWHRMWTAWVVPQQCDGIGWHGMGRHGMPCRFNVVMYNDSTRTACNIWQHNIVPPQCLILGDMTCRHRVITVVEYGIRTAWYVPWRRHGIGRHNATHSPCCMPPGVACHAVAWDCAAQCYALPMLCRLHALCRLVFRCLHAPIPVIKSPHWGRHWMA